MTSIGKEHFLSLRDCPKTNEQKNHMRKIPYWQLIYAMFCTRLEIHFAVGTVSQLKKFRVFPLASREDLQVTFWDPNFVLCYPDRDIRLTGFHDTDWASDEYERKSTSSCIPIRREAILRWSKKQCCSVYQQYVKVHSLCNCTAKAIWLKFFQCVHVTARVMMLQSLSWQYVCFFLVLRLPSIGCSKLT